MQPETAAVTLHSVFLSINYLWTLYTFPWSAFWLWLYIVQVVKSNNKIDGYFDSNETRVKYLSTVFFAVVDIVRTKVSGTKAELNMQG